MVCSLSMRIGSVNCGNRYLLYPFDEINRSLDLFAGKNPAKRSIPARLMQLTTHTDYALRLLLYVMSQAPRKVSTCEAADAFAISLNHLTKVAKALTQGGYLITARGGGGGLQLAPEAEKVS